MQIEMPFFESPEDALKTAVQQLGGAKRVGAKLWPDLTIDAAGRKLLDALNPARPEKLDVTQVMFILREAKGLGYHQAFAFIAGEVGYDARPVTKAEEVDRVTAVVEQTSHVLASALATLERLQRAERMKVVA